MSVIKCEEKTMGIQRFTKLVTHLDLGHCSLGAEDSNVCRVEVTP